MHLRSGGYDQIDALDNFRPSCLRKAGEHQCDRYIEWQQPVLEIGDEAVAQCEKLIGSRTFALAYELEDALPEETSQKSMFASRSRAQNREVVECSVLCHCVCG